MRIPSFLPSSIPRPSRGRFGRPDEGPAGGAAVAADGALFDEALLGRLRRLTLLAGNARPEGIAGEHRSRRRGASPEFADFKSYSQGDDFRRIDWNTYARLDGLFVRLSEVTTELNVHVLLDASASMDWRGDRSLPTKLTYARRLAGAIGYVALWHFDRVVIAPFGDAVGVPFGPAQGRSHLVPMLRYLERLEPLGRTALTGTIDRYARARRRPGYLVVVSDLLSGEPAELRDLLRGLRGRGWRTVILHVLDAAEVAPDAAVRYLSADGPGGAARPPAELVDVEGGERLRLSPTDGVVDRYVALVEGWLAELETICREEDALYARLLTSWEFEEVVLGLLHRRGMVA